jgi:hypothetical protein
MVRNIAQREQARDNAQELAQKIERLKEKEAGIKTSNAPAQTKEKSLEQVRETTNHRFHRLERQTLLAFDLKRLNP